MMSFKKIIKISKKLFHLEQCKTYNILKHLSEKYLIKNNTSCISLSFKRRSAFAVLTLLGRFCRRGIEVRELSRLLQGNEHAH